MQHYFKRYHYITLCFVLTGIIIFTTSAIKKASPQKVTITIVYDTTAFLPGKDTIAFRPSYLLKWTDFEAPVPKNNTDNTVANSAVGFKFNATLNSINNTVIINIKITSFFIRSKSWGISKEKTNYILNHEQNHFYIARYGAQIFKNNLLKAKINKSNLNAVLTKTYQNAWNAYTRLQDQYDKETKNSINKVQQAIWDKRIENYVKTCN